MSVPKNTRRGKSYGPFGRAAGYYNEAGFMPLPVTQGTKKIAVNGYTGRDGKWTEVAGVARWISQYPDHNIAIRMPKNVIGIDVDDYDGKAGAETMWALERELGELPATLASTSREDGLSGIRLYRVPEGIDWRGGLPGIEILTWYHRYAMVWPSIHPDTGRMYEWHAWQLGEMMPYGESMTMERMQDELGNLPELPDEWVEHLRRQYTSSSAKSGKLERAEITAWLRDNGAGSPCEMISLTAEKWRSELEGAGEIGGAHEVMVNGVKALIGDAMEGHTGMLGALSEFRDLFYEAAGDRREQRDIRSEWMRAVYGAVRLYWNAERPDDPCEDEAESMEWTPTRLNGQVVTADAYHSGTRGEDKFELAVKRRLFDKRVDWEANRRIRRDSATEAPEPVRGDAFMAMEMPPVRVLIDSLLPYDGNTLLVAQRKAGKTTLVHNIMRSLLNGDDFLGAFEVMRPEDDKSIVLFDFEMQPGMLQEWLKAQGMSRKVLQYLHILSFRGLASSFSITGPNEVREWSDRLRDLNPGYVILDCYAPAVNANGMDENSNSDAGLFLGMWDEMIKSCGATGSLISHHMGHSNERGRGASKLRDWPETEMHLIVEGQGEETDTGRLRPRAPRYLSGEGRLGAFDEIQLQFDESTKHLVVSGGSRAEAAREAAKPDVMAFLSTTPGASKTMVDKALPARNGATARAIAILIQEGEVCQHQNGRTHSLYLESDCPDNSVHATRFKME